MTSAFRADCGDGWSTFFEKVAKLLDHLEQAECPYQLLEVIRVIVPFRFALSVVHQRGAPPVHMADTFAKPLEKQALARYLDNTYILNPVYNAYLKGLGEGVYRMRELAPDNYFSSDYYRQFKAHELAGEEIGYKTYGWPAGMEELLIIIDLAQGKIGEVSLSRASNSGGFQEIDCQNLRIIAPFISAIYRRLWQNHEIRSKVLTTSALPLEDFPKTAPHFLGLKAQQNTRIETPPISPSGIKTALEFYKNFLGDGRLSQREREVAHMILQGHSSQSISLNLGISLTTVKTHRRNLYAKLNISTQQELFAAFLACLPTFQAPPSGG